VKAICREVARSRNTRLALIFNVTFGAAPLPRLPSGYHRLLWGWSLPSAIVYAGPTDV